MNKDNDKDKDKVNKKNKNKDLDYNINYYSILGVDKDASSSELKKKYYKLVQVHHPDKGGKHEDFDLIVKSYKILSDYVLKNDYDKKSIYGKDYIEINEIYKTDTKLDINKFLEKKRKEDLDIEIEIDIENFDGKVEYNRYMCCSTCDGTGYDFTSQIVIIDKNGKKSVFEGDSGCDFCEGTGIGFHGESCKFCQGKGKIGTSSCVKCKGEKVILYKQKLNNIKLEIKGNEEDDDDSNETKIEYMGHFSKLDVHFSGDLYLIYKKKDRK